MYKTEIGYKILKPFIAFYYKFRFKPIIIGSENIPLKGPIIFCGNHINFYDQFNVMLATKRVIHMMAKDEYFKGKRKWFYKITGCIPVNRSIRDKNAVCEAIDLLNSGMAVGLFPEGTRNEVTCRSEEVEKLSKILNISNEEVISLYKNRCIRKTQVHFLEEIYHKKIITKKLLKEYVIDPDFYLNKLLKSKKITKEEYTESLLLPFKYGAVSMAKKTGALIIPYAINGSYDGNGVITKIGKPIDVKDLDIESANKILRKNIIELMKKSK